MAWRIAKSLGTLRSQINHAFPNRSKISDGVVGDQAHSSRRSDHNPNSKGVVCAFDITHDPKNGPDCHTLVAPLLADYRTKYIIWNGKIYNPSILSGKARVYTGSNPHNKHLHISVRSDAQLYDDAKPWAVGASTATKATSEVATVPKTAKPAVAPSVARTVPILEQTGNKYDPQRAVSFFRGRGWNQNAAVALVANIMWESGGNSKWTIVWDAKGDKDKQGVYRSRYCAQWNGPRIEAFEKFARKNQREYLDPYAQLAFIEHELKTTERKAGILLKNATSLEEAVAAAITFWRPSIPHADKRLAIARKLLDG